MMLYVGGKRNDNLLVRKNDKGIIEHSGDGYNWDEMSPRVLSMMTWEELAQEASEGFAAMYVHPGMVLRANNSILSTGESGKFDWMVTDVTDTDIGLLAYKVAKVTDGGFNLSLQFDSPQKETNADGVANPGGTSAIQYGSNLYPDSWFDQFLNTAAAAGEWGTPATGWHNTPSWVTQYDGFMKGFDADFLAAVKTSGIKVNIALPWQAPLNLPAQVTLQRKFFLLAGEEVGFTDTISGQSEGSVSELYRNASNVNRIKYQTLDGTARHWWLRSNNGWSSHGMRAVYSSGAVNGYYAYAVYAVVPACRIGISTEAAQ